MASQPEPLDERHPVRNESQERERGKKQPEEIVGHAVAETRDEG
jgi:hypothetical protein